MNSGLMTSPPTDTDNFIGDLEYFRQYHSWLPSEHKGTNIQTNPTKVRNSQLYVGSNSHVFTEITLVTFIIPVK